MMTHWKYKILCLKFYTNPRYATEQLNRWGDEGWELIGFDLRAGDNRYIFKKPLHTKSKHD